MTYSGIKSNAGSTFDTSRIGGRIGETGKEKIWLAGENREQEVLRRGRVTESEGKGSGKEEKKGRKISSGGTDGGPKERRGENTGGTRGTEEEENTVYVKRGICVKEYGRGGIGWNECKVEPRKREEIKTKVGSS